MSCKNCRACQIREKRQRLERLASQRAVADKEEASKARKALEEQFVKGHAIVARTVGEILKDEPQPVETP